jgi:hypothetical protein
MPGIFEMPGILFLGQLDFWDDRTLKIWEKVTLLKEFFALRFQHG